MNTKSANMTAIPVRAAEDIAKTYGYDQVVIVARAVGQGEHVTTFGINPAHCSVAAKMGDFFKYHLMRWKPEGDPHGSTLRLLGLAKRALDLPHPISANKYWRSFSHPRTGRNVVVVSREAKAFKEVVAQKFVEACGAKPQSGPLAVTYRYHPKLYRTNGSRNGTRLDLGNVEKVLSDAFKGVAWNDDVQLHRIVLELCERTSDGGVSVLIEPY